MDLPNLLMFCLISLVIGAVLMLILQYYIYVRFCDMPSMSREQKYFNEKYAIPEDIREAASKFDPDSKSTLMALNLIMQYLFHEIRHISLVRKWFYKKLTVELDELVSKTTIGKLFEKLTLRDLDLGDHFPEIKLFRVHNVEFHETEGRIEILDVVLEVKYAGNFRMTIDADMVLDKKASLTLKVRNLAGLARLQFTRKPYTHWSLSFLGDPDLNLDIESKFQGRHMQSNVSSLISNQIRRAIRRKHTLPKYKIRHKPFFPREREDVENDILPNGYLNVKIAELSRLFMPSTDISNIFCTLTMGSIAWVEANQIDESNILVTIEVKIHKAKNQQIGILFKQGPNSIEIGAILPNTPAVKSNLKPGDILCSIEATQVNSIQQVAKVMRSLPKPVFTLRVNRILPGILVRDSYDEATDIRANGDESNTTVKPSSQDDQVSIESPTSSIRQRIKNNTSNESMISNTPTGSPKTINIIGKAFKKTLSREQGIEKIPSDTASIRSNLLDEVPSPTLLQSMSFLDLNETIINYQQHTTVEFTLDNLMNIDDICQFKLDDNCAYLNVCVYGKQENKKILLGFRSIPVKHIMSECSETTLYEVEGLYKLMPPAVNDLKSHYLSSLKGFTPELCYGDILMSFSWNGNPYQHEAFSKKTMKPKSAAEKGDELQKSGTSVGSTKQHHFVRKHFEKVTLCDYCAKKIWLKDAVQCMDCLMVCHKKCITKCQNTTVCGPTDLSGIPSLQPEFLVTDASSVQEEQIEEMNEVEEKLIDLRTGREMTPRQSLSHIITQNLKRVNSAHNLCIPVLSTASNQNSRSLPPSPQHSPHRLSLTSQDISAFQLVTRILDSIPDDVIELTEEQMDSITVPIISISQKDDIMSTAKIASKDLFLELNPEDRVQKITELLTKLRLALDSATADHSKLLRINRALNTTVRWKMDEISEKELSANSSESIVNAREDQNDINEVETMDGASALDKSDERVQALSVLMLFFCTGLQHAQGVAPP